MVVQLRISEAASVGRLLRSIGVNVPAKTRDELVARVVGGEVRDDGQIVRAAGHKYQWLAGATTIADLPGLIPLKPYDLEQWGVEAQANTGNAVFAGDFSVEIQAAHDYVSGLGGGKLAAPEGVIPMAATVYWGEGAGVLLVGQGRGSIGGTKSDHLASAGTRFYWTGGATGEMFRLTSDRGDTGLLPRRSGGGFIDLMIDGGEVAGYGLRIYSHAAHELRIMVSYCTKINFYASVLSNGLDAQNTANTQRFIWDIHANSGNAEAVEPDALMFLDGDPGVPGNVSLGHITNLHLRSESTAVCAYLGSCDTLTIQHLHAGARAAPTGDGGKVILLGAGSAPAGIGANNERHPRALTIAQAQCPDGLELRTGSGLYPPDKIIITNWSTENGGGDPDYEDGSKISFFADVGEPHWAKFGGNGITQFGLGSTTSTDLPSPGDIDAFDIPNGFYRVTNADLGTRPPGATDYGALTCTRYDGDNCQQYYHQSNQNEVWHRASVAGVWDDWRLLYDQGNVIGSVAQTGGVPTGGLIEAGSNANGSYARYADGTQICWNSHTIAYASASSLSATWTYPAAFAAAPVVQASLNSSNFSSNATPSLQEICDPNPGTVTTSSALIRMYRIFGMTDFDPADDTKVFVTAIGSWY